MRCTFEIMFNALMKEIVGGDSGVRSEPVEPSIDPPKEPAVLSRSTHPEQNRRTAPYQ